jgi:hypothetical protein
MITIDDLKDRFTIPYIWKNLNLPGEPMKRCRSPFRKDRNPSFSTWEGSKGWRWKDHGTGEGGDVINFIAKARGLTDKEAIKLLLEMAGADRVSFGFREPGRNVDIKQEIKEFGIADSYVMTRSESTRARMACEALASSPELLERVATWRGWSVECIKGLAMDMALGWEDGRLCFIYETGMKTREHIEAPKDGRIIKWAFGKPFLWRVLSLVEPSFSRHVKNVWITEGETDCITLVNQGFETPDLETICVALPSASTFNEGWIWLFRGKTVTIATDSDKAGVDARIRIQKLLLPVARQTRYVDWSKLKA